MVCLLLRFLSNQVFEDLKHNSLTKLFRLYIIQKCFFLLRKEVFFLEGIDLYTSNTNKTYLLNVIIAIKIKKFFVIFSTGWRSKRSANRTSWSLRGHSNRHISIGDNFRCCPQTEPQITRVLKKIVGRNDKKTIFISDWKHDNVGKRQIEATKI